MIFYIVLGLLVWIGLALLVGSVIGRAIRRAERLQQRHQAAPPDRSWAAIQSDNLAS